MRATIDRWLDRMVARIEAAYRARGIMPREIEKNERKAHRPRPESQWRATKRRKAR